MNSSARLVVVGAGGFGREVIDVVDAVNSSASVPLWEVVGVLDDAPSEVNLRRLEKRGVSYLGGTDGHIANSPPAHYLVGVGSPRVRRKMAAKFDNAGWLAATVVHPTATMGFDVRVGDGSVICAGVRLTTNIGLGRHVHLNLNCTVGHDCVIGDFVSVNPLASVSGDCIVEDGVLIGVAGVVLNGLRVGRDAVVGGSACAVKDVPPEVVIVGVPGRQLRRNEQ